MARDPHYVLGLDVGITTDPSALCLLEFAPFTEPTVYLVRGLHRYPLGTHPTALPALLEPRLTDDRIAGRVRVAIDATGIGAAVAQLFRERLPGIDVYAINIIGGATGSCSEKNLNVPKQDLVATTSVILAEGCVRIAGEMRERDSLNDELTAYQQVTSDHGHRTYNAPHGEHDDLVIALSLALWLAENRPVRAPYQNRSFDPGEIEGIVPMGDGIISS
jgi:hypothetical protein